MKRLVQEHGVSFYFPSVQADAENELLLDDLERAPTGRNAVQELAEYNMATYGQPFEANPHILAIPARIEDESGVSLARLFGERLYASNTPFDILRVFLLILDPPHASSIYEDQATLTPNAVELLASVVSGVCHKPSNCGSLLSAPQQLLLEETIYRQLWGRENAASVYRMFKGFEIPTFHKPDDGVVCNASLAKANFAEVLVKEEGQAGALASNLIACSDQSVCRMTQNSDAIRTFDRELRDGWQVGGNSVAAANAVVEVVNRRGITTKTLAKFFSAHGGKALLEQRYEWIAARIELPSNVKKDHFEALIDLFPPIKERPFAHYFVHILLPNLHHLQNAAFAEATCALLKAGAEDASLVATDLDRTVAAVPEPSRSLPLPVVVNKEVVDFVARQMLHCSAVTAEGGDKIDMPRFVFIVHMAKNAKSKEVFDEALRFLEHVEDEYWQHAEVLYFVLTMAFEQDYSSTENRLAEKMVVKKKLNAFPAVVFPASTGTGSAPTIISLGEVDSLGRLKRWAQAHYYAHGYKWPSFASWVAPKVRKSADLEDQLAKHFGELDKVHRFKLLVDLASASLDDDSLSVLIGALCDSEEEYCQLDQNKCAGFLVNAVLKDRSFQKSGRRWRSRFEMTSRSAWLEPGLCDASPRMEGVSERSDVGRFEDEVELCRLACSRATA